jgi:chromosomal replication initiator protein
MTIDSITTTTSHEQHWANVQQDLTRRYGEAISLSWFSKMRLVNANQYIITLGVPTNFMKDWIKTNYLDLITQLFKHYDNQIQTIQLVTIDAEPHAAISCVTEAVVEEVESDEEHFLGSVLDSRFTFDNFVVGRPNELAYAAAKAVAESKEAIPESNPLFLYGGVGLGKTHLMHSIAWNILQENPGRKVIYMSAEKFMYQFVRALRNKDVMSFKERFVQLTF